MTPAEAAPDGIEAFASLAPYLEGVAVCGAKEAACVCGEPSGHDGPHVADITAPWRQQAACRGKPTWWWYPTRDEHATAAIAICRTCPVRSDCLTAGLDEAHGHWGGESERGRRRIRQIRSIRAQRAARGLT